MINYTRYNRPGLVGHALTLLTVATLFLISVLLSLPDELHDCPEPKVSSGCQAGSHPDLYRILDFKHIAMPSKRKVVVSRDIGQKALFLLSELDSNEWDIILWKLDDPAPRSWLEHNVENADGLLVQITDKVRPAMLDYRDI
jgi:hypothetical protein